MVYTPESVDGEQTRIPIYRFKGPSIAQTQLNTDEPILQFAHTSFRYALRRGLPLYVATQNNVMKQYDGHFVAIFKELYETQYKSEFEKQDYDGDVQSDLVAQGFGSLGLMTSVLTTVDGKAFESEAAHGTVTRYFCEHQKGKKTSTNPIATIFAWTRGLIQRGKLDHNPEFVMFSESLEKACIDTVDLDGIMTQDLAIQLVSQTSM